MRYSPAILFTVIALFSACSRTDVDSPSTGLRSDVRFVISVSDTKAPVTAYEDDVYSLQALVFRQEDGQLDAGVSVSAVSSFTVEVMQGRAMRWVVLANAPVGFLDGVTSYSGFLTKAVALEDNSASSLVMYDSGTWSASGPSGSVSVQLRRYASKVSVMNVAVPWISSFSTAPAMSVGRIALINVNGTVPCSGTPACGTLWYNRLGIDAGLSSLASGMLVAPAYGTAVTDASPVSVACSLYAMPNPVSTALDSDTAPEWSERATMVAVELLVDGISNWYPVALPAMACNHHYLINRLSIAGPGASTPGGAVDRSLVSFSVEVRPWGEASSGVSFPLD